MLGKLRRRLADDRGFGLVELLIAMTVLSVGVFAIVAAYTSTTASLVRASRTATAGVLADKQLELYRAVTYAEIRLVSSSVPTSGDYVTDTAYPGSLAALHTGTCSPVTDVCNAARTVTGPDGRSYRVDTYIVYEYPTGSSSGSRYVKKVTVVVRDGTTLGQTPAATPLARQISTFDELSGSST